MQIIPVCISGAAFSLLATANAIPPIWIGNSLSHRADQNPKTEPVRLAPCTLNTALDQDQLVPFCTLQTITRPDGLASITIYSKYCGILGTLSPTRTRPQYAIAFPRSKALAATATVKILNGGWKLDFEFDGVQNGRNVKCEFNGDGGEDVKCYVLFMCGRWDEVAEKFGGLDGHYGGI